MDSCDPPLDSQSPRGTPCGYRGRPGRAFQVPGSCCCPMAPTLHGAPCECRLRLGTPQLTPNTKADPVHEETRNLDRGGSQVHGACASSKSDSILRPAARLLGSPWPLPGNQLQWQPVDWPGRTFLQAFTGLSPSVGLAAEESDRVHMYMY